MDSTENEEDEIAGQINDENVARFLAEAEKAEKELEENMTEEEKVAREEQRKEYTVLVVEDNHDLRKYLYTILSEHYNVLLAENGKAGLLMTRTELPDFIITDVTMPVMDGITMVGEIKQDHELADSYHHPLGKGERAGPTEGIRDGRGCLHDQAILYRIPAG